MHPVQFVASIVFVLSWLGAAGAWATGAYSLVRVFADGPIAAVGDRRARAFKALAWSVTFVVTGFLSAMASGALAHLHI